MKDFIIFLDFDGPLFSKRSLLLEENNEPHSKPICKALDLHHSVNYWKMDPCSVAILNNLINLNKKVKLVISSSWSNPHFHEKKHIQDLLEINKIKYTFHEDWRTNKVGKRVEDIADWLKNHSQSFRDYLILDDLASAPEMVNAENSVSWGVNPTRVILTSIEDGLSYQNFLIAQEIISKS